MSFSTAYAPPAGSATVATCDSSMSRYEVLRAIRRPNASGRPSGLSNGSTVTASAPPTPAAKAATRGAQHVHPGSYLLIIGRLVTACWRCRGRRRRPLSSSDPGPEPAGGAELGDGRELLVGGGVAELDQPGGLVDARARRRSSARRYVRADGQRRSRAPATSEAPRSCTAVASTTNAAARRVSRGLVARRLAGGVPRPATPRLVPACEVAVRRRSRRKRAGAGRPRRRGRPARGRGARRRAGRVAVGVRADARATAR